MVGNYGSIVFLSNRKTRFGWAALSLISKDVVGYRDTGKPANLLLAVTGFVENKDMAIKPVSNSSYHLERRRFEDYYRATI